MAVYKIFPEKDATIYSEYPSKNTGLDEILDTSVYLDADLNSQKSRFLIKFPSDEIISVFDNYIDPEGLTWSASLRCYSAYAEGITGTTTVQVYLVSGSWNMGTGKYVYDPEYTNGVSWDYKVSSGSSPWVQQGGDYFQNFVWTQSFSYYNDLDLNIDLNGIGNDVWDNDGFIIKQSNESINNLNSQVKLKYFSRFKLSRVLSRCSSCHFTYSMISFFFA